MARRACARPGRWRHAVRRALPARTANIPPTRCSPMTRACGCRSAAMPSASGASQAIPDRVPVIAFTATPIAPPNAGDQIRLQGQRRLRRRRRARGDPTPHGSPARRWWWNCRWRPGQDGGPDQLCRSHRPSLCRADGGRASGSARRHRPEGHEQAPSPSACRRGSSPIPWRAP